MNENATAIVLGMTCNGLSVVRSLGRNGVKVIAVDAYLERAGLRSRYCKFVEAPCNIIDNEDPWLSFLVELARQEKSKPVLFPTEDAYVLFISKHRAVLKNYYHFNIASDDIAKAAVSKLGTYNLAMQCGIGTPWTYLIKKFVDYEKIADKITFPCALKPSYAHVWLKNYTHEKLIVIQQPNELETRLKELEKLRIEVVLQELIPGGDDQVFVLPIYVSNKGDVLGYANLRKIRQRPVDFGVGAFNISVDEPRLIETQLKLIKESGFRGMASTEYKWDSRDGKFKLIDINPRTCMIEELAIASGVDLPYLYYCDMVGKELRPVHRAKVGIKWFSFEWDFSSFIVYRQRGELNFGGWISSLRGKKVYAYYAADDLKPFIQACYLHAIRGINKFKCKLRPTHN